MLWKSNKYYIFWVCVCSLSYPTCTLKCYIMLSSVACRLLQYLSTLSHERHNFRVKVTEQKMHFFIFSWDSVWNISQCNKNSARYHKCTEVYMWSTHYYFQIWMKFEIFQQVFQKYSNIKIHEIPSSSMRADRWTDRQIGIHDKDNSHFFVVLWTCLKLIEMQLMLINIYEISN